MLLFILIKYVLRKICIEVEYKIKNILWKNKKNAYNIYKQISNQKKYHCIGKVVFNGLYKGL